MELHSTFDFQSKSVKEFVRIIVVTAWRICSPGNRKHREHRATNTHAHCTCTISLKSNIEFEEPIALGCFYKTFAPLGDNLCMIN